MTICRTALAAALFLTPLTLAAQEAELAPPICDYGEAHADAPDELAQFDFLIGDFTVTAHAWQDGAWTPPAPDFRARWNGYYTLGGMAIADEWFWEDPAINPATERGINVRMWDSEQGEWDMMWVASTQRQVQDLRAGVIDGVLTMWQVYPERPDFRATFHREGPDSWHRISYEPDGEGGWTPQFKLVAQRIACA